MSELRWRRVQVIDEGWQLELADPSFKAKDDDEIDGWRPLACLWKWARSSESRTPWRAVVEEMGIRFHNGAGHCIVHTIK